MLLIQNSLTNDVIGGSLRGFQAGNVQCHHIHVVLVNSHSAQRLALCDRYLLIFLSYINNYCNQSHYEGEFKLPFAPGDVIVLEL